MARGREPASRLHRWGECCIRRLRRSGKLPRLVNELREAIAKRWFVDFPPEFIAPQR